MSRLVELEEDHSNGTGQNMLTIGGLSSLRSMGSGGGFASVAVQDVSNEMIEERFIDWIPSLKGPSMRLLTEHGFKLAEFDPSFQTLQLIWMNRPNDGASCLLGKRFSSAEHYEMKTEETGASISASSI